MESLIRNRKTNIIKCQQKLHPSPKEFLDPTLQSIPRNPNKKLTTRKPNNIKTWLSRLIHPHVT